MTEQEIFMQALDLPPDARPAFLERVCAGQPALLASVAALLKAHEGASGFLDTPPKADLDASIPSLAVGAMIGPYRLVEQIGEGGMGTVFRAEQMHPVRRTVALKIVKAGMDSRQVVARFEAERQALAVMDHPNIAKVLDAGVTEYGRPYFVMEHVEGRPITQFCDASRLTIDQRLELFVPVCYALQHAHQKGVIHRDIKPSNVLVALYDGKPVPKVIDFGVAKAVEQDQADPSLGTQFGQVVGTLEYMSPEQAERSPKGIDTRSDVYSLGVLLYELLTGATPLGRERLAHASYAQLLVIIKEVDPPTPSTRLTDSGEALASISAVRKTEPRKLSKLVRGELDWIVMKCLEKDRDRRYPSANDLAADLLRHLSDEPVQAGPPSRLYRVRKFVRRNKGPLIAASIVLLTLIGGIVGTTSAMLDAKAARKAERDRADGEKKAAQEAQERDAETQAILNFVTKKILAAAGPKGLRGGLGKDVRLREAVMSSLAALEKDFVGRPLIEARLRKTIGDALYDLGDFRQAVPQFERAHELSLKHCGPEHRNTLTTATDVAIGYSVVGRTDDAIRILEPNIQTLRRVLGEDDPVSLTAMESLATAYMINGRLQDAIELRKRHAELERRTTSPADQKALLSKYHLAINIIRVGKAKESAALLEEVRDGYKALGTPDHPLALSALSQLATAYMFLNREADARELWEQTLPKLSAAWPAEHPAVINAKEQLALNYTRAGRHDEALKLREEVYAVVKPVFPPTHPDVFSAMRQLQSAYVRLKRYPDSIRVLEEYLAAQKTALAPDHADRLLVTERLAASYTLALRDIDALNVYEQSLAAIEKVRPPNRKLVMQAKQNIAKSLAKVKRSGDAVRLIDECLSPSNVKDLDPKLISGLLEIRIRHFLEAGDPAQCRATAAQAEQWIEVKAIAPYNAACFRALASAAYAKARQPAEAAADADRAMAWLNQAVAAGLDKRIQPEKDPDLRALLERDDFKRLLGSIKPSEAMRIDPARSPPLKK